MKNVRIQLVILLAVMLITAANLSAQTPQTPQSTPSPKPVATPQRPLTLGETIATFDAPEIRTLKLNSKLMGREMTYRVIMPRDYESLKDFRFPVVYLLHGLTGHFDNWTEKTKVGDYVRSFGYFIVTPEGGDGWYTDSVSVPNDKFESYIIQELIPEIDKNLRTKTARENRAIAGLSMGGYGALKFGLKYPDKFILAGSFSGALGITALPTATAGYPSVKNVFGEDDSQTRKDNDIFRILRDMPADKIKDLPFLYVACGTEDFLISNNQDFMKLLSEKKVRHEYRQLPGAHSWAFWDDQIRAFLPLSERFLKK
jgi:S-formylglutathione hydrolase FrmB